MFVGFHPMGFPGYIGGQWCAFCVSLMMLNPWWWWFFIGCDNHNIQSMWLINIVKENHEMDARFIRQFMLLHYHSGG